MDTSESGNFEATEPGGESGDSVVRGRGDSSPHQAPTAREAAAAFAAELAAAVTRRVSRTCAAEPVGLSAESLADFHASMQPEGARLLLTSRCPQRTDRTLEVVLEIPPAPAFTLVDALLGGGMGDYLPNRAVNATERRLLSRVAAEAVEALCRRIWSDAGGRTSVESADAPAEADRPSEPVLVVRTEVTLDRTIGTLRLAIPRGAVAGTDPDRQPRADKLVQLTVESADENMTGEDLEGLSPGDILITDLPADGEVEVRVAGIAKFVGRLAAGNGRRAVHVTGRRGRQ